MSQNTLPNGPSEVTDSKNAYEPVKTPSSGSEFPQQPIYAPHQVDGASRPQLLRLDSRSTLSPRPGFPNPLLRPPQPRPPPPGGTPTPFIQRPPLPQRPPGPGQNIFPQGQPPRPVPSPTNSGNVGARPPIPFQRPQAPGIRPQNLFQQRAAPTAGTPRPPFNSYPRSQTLDSSDLNLTSQNVDNVDSVLSTNNKNENERPALAAMKNRSFSVTEPKPVTTEDRRRSVSSIGSIEEEKKIISSTPEIMNGKAPGENYSRPESRTDSYMKKIAEDDDKVITSSQLPSKRSSIVNSSIENLTEKVVSNVPLSPSPTVVNQTPTSKSPAPVSPGYPTSPQRQQRSPASPQQKSPAFNTGSTEKLNKSPTRVKPELKEENANFEKPERKSPDSRPPSSAKLKLFKTEGDNDSGVDESTQGNDPLSNGDQNSPKKSTKHSTPRSSTTPTKNKSFTRGSKSPNPKSPETPTASTPGTADKKKVPMNKVQVGSAPSPNLKVIKSKIGSLQNASHKPGGGNIKIENRKIDFSTASSRITAKNDAYIPGGGDKKIQQQKLTWNAKSKIGSLENTTHKPKGGEKKIESVKLDFKDKAKPKVGSKDNMKHVPGGGDVKIESKKLDIKVQSKIRSLDNIKHKPGGGDKKIFDDKEYLRQTGHSTASLDGSQNSSQTDVREPVSDENLNSQR